MGSKFIGYKEALDLTLSQLNPLKSEEKSLSESLGYVAAEDIISRVNSPSASTSLKDGYAVRSDEIAGATPDSPMTLKLQGVVAAGALKMESVEPGTTLRVLTGAVIPQGADAVVAEEYTRVEHDRVTVF